jgi:predicted RNA-binding Zn ribbon-like protein
VSGVKVQFAHDTEVALAGVAALVNTTLDDEERLPDPPALDALLDELGFSGSRAGTTEELTAVHDLRHRLRSVWDADDEDAVVALVNDLLRTAVALPQLTRHDGWDWHLHLTTPDAPLVDRWGTEAAMAVADLVRARDLDRLKRCAADDCDAVLVDLSRNRSRRYCDTGNCANRAHVAAYRARRARAGHDDAG